MRERSDRSSFPHSCPSTSTCPAVGVCSPTRISMAVVFPAPLGPSRPKHSPARISRSRESTATTVSYRLTRPRRETAGPRAGEVSLAGRIPVDSTPVRDGCPRGGGRGEGSSEVAGRGPAESDVPRRGEPGDRRVLPERQPSVARIADPEEVEEKAHRDVQEDERKREKPRRAGFPVEDQEGGAQKKEREEELVPAQVVVGHPGQAGRVRQGAKPPRFPVEVGEVGTRLRGRQAYAERKRRDRSRVVVGYRAAQPPDRPREGKDERDGVEIPPAGAGGRRGRLPAEEEPDPEQRAEDPAEGADVFPDLEKHPRVFRHLAGEVRENGCQVGRQERRDQRIEQQVRAEVGVQGEVSAPPNRPLDAHEHGDRDQDAEGVYFHRPEGEDGLLEVGDHPERALPEACFPRKSWQLTHAPSSLLWSFLSSWQERQVSRPVTPHTWGRWHSVQERLGCSPFRCRPAWPSWHSRHAVTGCASAVFR